MIPLRPIGIQTAQALVDFGGRSAAAHTFAPDQLKGAVALHNILAERGFAYLADEVGMGKTYVALGVVGLLRHFHPGLRVLYVVPRSNLQDKWRKEARNFAANNWRLPDLRVKTLQGTPGADMVVCNSLDHFVHEAHANANRDFVLRMSSFSLALRGDSAGWKKKRRALKKLLPWLPASAFDLRDKTRFKQTYARAINAAIPHFDLLVVDEAHNFRHGYEHGSMRNQLLGLVLGLEDEDIPYLRGEALEVDRVLALSATPLETDYLELWNQMSLFGAPNVAPELKDPERPADEQQQATQRFMVRRLTGLELGDRRYTKNMYRREWRRGGVDAHGTPLRMADDRERLVVALVQKKVSDVLAQLGRGSGRSFGRRFQMGMLASFESFLETVKLADTEDDPTFDQADQTDDELEREGVDAVSIAHLSRSYRERFQEPLPHPKMNAVASSLAEALERGEKTLVFVRRVASVPELVAKVAQRYDRWLCEQLERSAPGVTDQIRRELRRYRTATSRAEEQDEPSDDDEPTPEDDDLAELVADDTGSDSFFAWFFRGERKLGVASGGWFRRRRLTDEKEELSLLLEENYLGWLLRLARPTLDDLAGVVGVEPDVLSERLRARAYAIFREGSKQTRFPVRRVFRAYQQAALAEIGGSKSELVVRARGIARHRGWTVVIADEGPVPADFPGPRHHLGRQTLFSILRAHPLGQKELRLDDLIPGRFPPKGSGRHFAAARRFASCCPPRSHSATRSSSCGLPTPRSAGRCNVPPRPSPASSSSRSRSWTGSPPRPLAPLAHDRSCPRWCGTSTSSSTSTSPMPATSPWPRSPSTTRARCLARPRSAECRAASTRAWSGSFGCRGIHTCSSPPTCSRRERISTPSLRG